MNEFRKMKRELKARTRWAKPRLPRMFDDSSCDRLGEEKSGSERCSEE